MEEGVEKPPFGHIFAGFMIMCMLGSRLFSYLAQFYPVEMIGVGTLAVSAGCHIVPIIFSHVVIRFFSFMVFEACVGLYFPMISTLKGQLVPEAHRSTIYNLFRVPLNAIVVMTLVMNFDVTTSFFITTTMLGISVFAQLQLQRLRLYQPVQNPKS